VNYRFWASLILTVFSFITGPAFAVTNTTKLPLNQVVTTPPIEKSPYDLSWSTGLAANRSEDDLSNQKNMFYLKFKMTLEMKINNWLSLNLAPKASVQSGYAQAMEQIDPNGSRVDIYNASLDMRPSSYFSSSIGVLNQGTFHDELFISSRAFPALRLQAHASNKKFYSFIESAMPTTSSMSNNSNDLNQTPSLNMGGLGVDLGSEKDVFNFKAQVNAFQYDGLPTPLATASVLQGNSGTNTTGTDYKFKYQYQGIEAFSIMKLNATRNIQLVLSTAYLTNTQAPVDKNAAWAARGAFHWSATNKMQLIPVFEYYRVESDATIAAYNDVTYQTNRIGYLGGLKIKYNKTVKFEISAGQRAAIIENPSQPSENVYILKVETEDAKL
jgi:hypothetical protein